MTRQDDQQLVDLCLAGQTEAFGQLVERYQDRLFHSLIPLLKSRDDAQDIAQDAVLQAYQKLDSYRGEAAFYTWLYRIAINTAMSFLRRRRHKTTSIESLRENIGEEPADQHAEAGPDVPVIRAEQRELVHNALAELPDDYRIVLILKEFEGLRYDEIAELVDCPLGTVRSRIHRGRLELAERLGRKLGPESEE